jgi:ABC-type nickel/cobalt efflux system permease component RcnA
LEISSDALPELNYQTPTGSSRVITAAWITLLVLGIFYSLGGACFGMILGALVFGEAALRPVFGATLAAALIILFIMITGIIYCWASIRVSKCSRPAAKVALVLTTIHAVLAVTLCIVGVIAAIVRGRGILAEDIVALFMGVLFYLTIAAGNGFSAWMLWKTMRELNFNEFPEGSDHVDADQARRLHQPDSVRH